MDDITFINFVMERNEESTYFFYHFDFLITPSLKYTYADGAWLKGSNIL